MKPLIVANWKCNPTSKKEADDLFNSIDRGANKDAEVVICPPFVFLGDLSNCKLGAQNCYFEEKGAFTGEVSVLMLKDLGVEYVIVGHSERRKYFNETDELVNKKIKAVLDAGLNPILCIGETQEQRDRRETEEVLRKQLELGLKDLDIKTLNIAYEPIWAIGTGNACEAKEAQRVSSFILKTVSEIFSEDKEVRVLYGGSVKKDNAKSYMEEESINGLLVGGASLNAEEFIEISKSA